MGVNDFARIDKIHVLKLARAGPEVITVEEYAEVGMSSFPVEAKSRRERGQKRRIAYELSSDLQTELTGYIGNLMNILHAPDIVNRREFGRGNARRIDQGCPEVGKLFAPFPKCIKIVREVRIGFPKACDPHRP